MESKLRQQLTNVADLKHVLKQKSTEHTVAQRETKKILRSTLTLTLTLAQIRSKTLSYPVLRLYVSLTQG
jgi:hypothetical protein